MMKGWKHSSENPQMTTFEEVLREVEQTSRAHRFVGTNALETLDYNIGGHALTPGFLYGVEFKEPSDEINYSALLKEIVSNQHSPSPICIHFGTEPSFIPEIDYCYSAVSLNAIEGLMDAHIQNGERFFILSSLQYFTLESDTCYSVLSDSLSFLRHMVQNRWRGNNKPFILITIPTLSDEQLMKNKMLNAFIEKIF